MTDNTRIVATIEARMGSTRLPGKHLLEVRGEPVLSFMISRIKQVQSIDDIILATTDMPQDSVLSELADNCGIQVFRGSSHDVLQRVTAAANKHEADHVVALTGDCPLIDPEVIDRCLRIHLECESDFTTNVEPPSFPVGMDVQVLSSEWLRAADLEAQDPLDREHVTRYLRKRPERFPTTSVTARDSEFFPDWWLALDELSDFRVIEYLISTFAEEETVLTCQQIVQFGRRNPWLLDWNSTAERKGIDD